MLIVKGKSWENRWGLKGRPTPQTLHVRKMNDPKPWKN